MSLYGRHSWLLIASMSFLLVMIVAPAAHALDMEFYTYGGFEPITTAFQKIALIFSDDNYKALFFSVAVAAMLFGGFTVYLKNLTGGKAPIFSWAWPTGIGVTLFFALVVPKGNLTVYDPTLNRFQTIGDIPDGIVALAGTLSTIEHGLVDIIDTSGTPESVKDYAGGIGFNALYMSTKTPLSFPDQYVDKSFRRYINDCFFFELQRPGSTVDINAIHNNTDFMSIFAEAQNPAVFTVYYNTGDNAGVTMSCTEAWENLRSHLNTLSNFNNMIDYVCSYSGFDVKNAQELAKCKSTLQDYISYVSDGAVSIPSANYLRQVYMAQTLNDIVLEASPDKALLGLANRNMMTGGIGIGMMANEWIPVLRAVLTAVIIGLVPFLAIFIPTPIVGKAIGIIAGFFVWLTAWGVTDAIAHGIAMDYGHKAFEYVRQHTLGLSSVMYMPEDSVKALSIFGLVRTAGIMMATVISSMLVKFGGHAMAIMAGNLMGTIQSQGIGAAMATQTPEGESNQLRQLEVAPSVMDNAHKFDFRQRAEAGMMQRRSQTRAAVDTVTELGGVDNAVSLLGRSKTIGNLERAGEAGERTFEGAMQFGGIEGRIKEGRAENLSLSDADQVGLVKASNEKYGAWRDPAQEMVASGLVSDLDKAMQMKWGLKAGKELGLYKESRDLAVHRLSEELSGETGVSPGKALGTIENLLTGDFDGVLKNPGQRRAVSGLLLEEGPGVDSENLTAADVAAAQKLIGERFDRDFERAGMDIQGMLPSKHAADIRGIEDAPGYSGDRQDFLAAVATRNYARLGTILSQHAEERGIAVFDAAQELGEWEGDKNLRAAQGYGIALDSVGSEQIRHLEANKILNEAAKFEQTYQFAESLGYAGSREDFQGMYKGHLSHHAQETWTLQDQATVDRLNQQMESQGFNTKFAVGDRIGMARTEDGHITLAKGRAGALREEVDMTRLVAGKEIKHLDVKSEEIGDTVSIKRGAVSPDTMMNAVISWEASKDDLGLSRRITDAPTVATREQEALTQRIAFAAALSQMVSRRGSTVSFYHVDGRGQLRVGTPGQGLLGVGADVSSSLSIGRRNNEEQNHDFYLAALGKIDEKAGEEATVNGIVDREKFREIRMEAYQQLYEAADAFLEGHTEFSFGASGVLGEALEETQRFFGQRKDKVNSSEKQDLDFTPF